MSDYEKDRRGRDMRQVRLHALESHPAIRGACFPVGSLLARYSEDKRINHPPPDAA